MVSKYFFRFAVIQTALLLELIKILTKNELENDFFMLKIITKRIFLKLKC